MIDLAPNDIAAAGSLLLSDSICPAVSQTSDAKNNGGRCQTARLHICTFQDGPLYFRAGKELQNSPEYASPGLFKATPHNPWLAPLHVICLHIFRHSTQIFLAGRQPACVKFMHCTGVVRYCLNNVLHRRYAGILPVHSYRTTADGQRRRRCGRRHRARLRF